MPSFSLAKIQIRLLATREHHWEFSGTLNYGVEHTYEVVDGNVPTANRWEFLLRVPHDAMERTVVKPHRIPSDESYSGLESRALTFTPASAPEYEGELYCEISLADSTGERNRKVARRSEADVLPTWFAGLAGRFRSKADVNPNLKRGGAQLVALVEPDDHETMLKLYMATKPWVLKSQYELPRP